MPERTELEPSRLFDIMKTRCERVRHTFARHLHVIHTGEPELTSAVPLLTTGLAERRSIRLFLRLIVLANVLRSVREKVLHRGEQDDWRHGPSDRERAMTSEYNAC